MKVLKIKDSVDLKVLENFGFEYHPNFAMRRYVKGNICIYENNDVQDKETCQKHNIQYLIPRVIYLENDCCDNIDYTETDGVLFELIHSDIVEVFEYDD